MGDRVNSGQLQLCLKESTFSGDLIYKLFDDLILNGLVFKGSGYSYSHDNYNTNCSKSRQNDPDFEWLLTI